MAGKAPERAAAGRNLLLVCATAMEMRAAIALLPGGPECDLSAWEEGAVLGRHYLPRLHLPGGNLSLLVCGVGPVASALSLALACSAPVCRDTSSGIVFARGAGQKSPARPRKNSPSLSDNKLEHYQVAGAGPFRGVVNMGIAGSYDCVAAPVGSVVLVDWECFPEYGVWPEYDESVDGLSENNGQPLALRFAQGLLPAGPVFSRLALDAHNTLGKLGLNCHTTLRLGGGATLSGVSGTRRRAGRMQTLTGALAGATIENMEGFALALGAAALGVPFVELRSVSNQAGFRTPHTWNVDAAAQALGVAAQNIFAPLL